MKRRRLNATIKFSKLNIFFIDYEQLRILGFRAVS